MRKTSLLVAIAMIAQIVLGSVAQAAVIPNNKVGKQMFAFGIALTTPVSIVLPSGQQTGGGAFGEGQISRYPEGSCIPTLVKIKNEDDQAGDIVFSPSFDYSKDGVVGVDRFEVVTSSLGATVQSADNLNDLTLGLADLSTATSFGTLSGGSVVATVSGPLADGVQGGVTMKKYDVVLKDVPAGETVLFLSCARLGVDASQFSNGANLSLRLSGGQQNIAIAAGTLSLLPTLTLVKKVMNDGPDAADAWSFTATPAIQGHANPLQPTLNPDGTASITIQNVQPNGEYSFSENGPSGYTMSLGDESVNCSYIYSGVFTAYLVPDRPARNVTCVFVNTYEGDQQEDPSTGTLTVEKIVVNDNGGQATVSDFQFFVYEAPGQVVDVQSGIEVQPGDATELAPGTYWVSEQGNAGGYYQFSFSGDCSEGGFVTIAAGETLTCTITNDDAPATLTVNKIVSGGTLAADDFDLFIDQTPVTNGEANIIDAGAYTVSETPVAGYAATFSGDCDGQGGITLLPGDQKQCTITNTYSVEPPATGDVTVTKIVINDDGGEAEVSDFVLSVGQTVVVSGETNAFPEGFYVVSESGPTSGYTATFSGDCDENGNITVSAGEPVNCVITNDDIEQEGGGDETGTLTVVKVVVNNDGGTAVIADFPLFIGTMSVTSGTPNFLPAGQHVVSETGSPNYSASFSGDCDVNGVVNLEAGDEKTCTITNDDNVQGGGTPPASGTLIVVTKVINDDGGIAMPSSFLMTVGDGIATSSTFGGFDTPGFSMAYFPGAYVVNGSENAAYDKTIGANCSGTMIAGLTVTCVVTYDDRPTGGSPTPPPEEPPAPPQPEPEVLGDTDDAPVPVPVPQVLGATDSDLPVTGMPAWTLASVLLAAAPFLRRKRA